MKMLLRLLFRNIVQTNHFHVKNVVVISSVEIRNGKVWELERCEKALLWKMSKLTLEIHFSRKQCGNQYIYYKKVWYARRVRAFLALTLGIKRPSLTPGKQYIQFVTDARFSKAVVKRWKKENKTNTKSSETGAKAPSVRKSAKLNYGVNQRWEAIFTLVYYFLTVGTQYTIVYCSRSMIKRATFPPLYRSVLIPPLFSKTFLFILKLMYS